MTDASHWVSPTFVNVLCSGLLCLPFHTFITLIKHNPISHAHFLLLHTYMYVLGHRQFAVLTCPHDGHCLCVICLGPKRIMLQSVKGTFSILEENNNVIMKSMGFLFVFVFLQVPATSLVFLSGENDTQKVPLVVTAAVVFCWSTVRIVFVFFTTNTFV